MGPVGETYRIQMSDKFSCLLKIELPLALHAWNFTDEVQSIFRQKDRFLELIEIESCSKVTSGMNYSLSFQKKKQQQVFKVLSADL